VAVAGGRVSAELPAVVPLPMSNTQTIVLDTTRTNERRDVSAAPGSGHVISIALAGLRAEQGSRKGVGFADALSAFKPTVDERLSLSLMDPVILPSFGGLFVTAFRGEAPEDLRFVVHALA
jgi:hypothetical protein